MGNFDTSTLQSEPTYYNLSPETQELIDTVRQVLVTRDEVLMESIGLKQVKTVHDRLPLRLKMSDEEIERELNKLGTDRN